MSGADTRDIPDRVTGSLRVLALTVLKKNERIAKLEAALRTCIQWAESDCEHDRKDELVTLIDIARNALGESPK